MSIHPDPFERLSKLLALKKYEKPPPRYFQEFSGRVIARIQAAEEAKPRSWWQWLGLDLAFLELKPAFVSALGVVLSAGLLVGMLIANPAQDSNTATASVQPLLNDSLEMASGNTFGTASANLSPQEVPASTAPVASAFPSASPFSHLALNAQYAGLVLR